MIAAILRAQLLSMRVGASRGAIFSIITGVIWYGIWAVAAIAAGTLASSASANQLEHYAPLTFLGICAYWQIVPVISASMGSGLDIRKLLIYPAAHATLFEVELLLRLIAGLEMIMVLAGGGIGILFNRSAGGWPTLMRLAAAILLFIAFNLLLASGLRSLLDRLLSRRRVREVLSFVLLMLYVVPRIMFQTGARFRGVSRATGALQSPLFPWTASAQLGLPLPGGAPWLALVSLLAWGFIALWFGRGQFERNLRFDAAAAQAVPMTTGLSRTRQWIERFYRLPSLLWRDPLAAIVEKELRSLLRTPRFRMVFIMGFTFGLMIWFPMATRRRLGGGGTTEAFGSRYFLAIVCVYAMTLIGQVTYWNCFGFDRSAAIFYFTVPQSLRKTLLGKNIAALVFIFIEAFVLTGLTAVLGLTSAWQTIAETLAVVGVCSLYMLALGNIASVHYPRGLTPERVSQGGASSRFQGLIFLLYPVALLPVGLAYLARYSFDSEMLFLILLALAAIGGGVFYYSAMESSASTAIRRREDIIRELSKGEGPVATE